MALSLPNTVEAASKALRWISLVDLEFPAGAIYVTDLDRNITVGGIVYSPAAVLQGFEGVGDHMDGKPRRLSVSVAGLDATTRARVLANRIAYGKARIRIGFCTDAWALVDTPVDLAVARLSNTEASYDEGTGSLEISMETSSILLRRDAKQLVSDESQKQRFAGDTGMSRVANIGTRQINWGGVSVVAAQVAPAGPIGGGLPRLVNGARGVQNRALVR